MEQRTDTAVSSSSEITHARDIHRAAAVLTLLVFLWGAITLLTPPWEPFWIPSLAQTLVCAGGLVYFVATWNDPRPRVSYVVSTILIVYSLVLLPWTTVVWCRLGRPVEAFFAARLGIISMALVFPGRLSLGVLVMTLFAAEGAFGFVYARHLGLDTLIPTNEPLATLAFFLLGIGVFILRRHRQKLARKYVAVQAEIHALERTRPLLARASTELSAHVSALTAVLATYRGEETARASGARRAVNRLGALGDQLQQLITPTSSAATGDQAEQALLARDAQLGAILFAGVTAVLGFPMTLWGWRTFGLPLSWILVANFALALVLTIYLVQTWRRPSSRRSVGAVLAMFATALPTTDYLQFRLLVASRPFVPFLGHKLLMCVLGLTLTTRFRLGVVLIVITAANAVILWFVLGLYAHTHLITVAEPWITLIFMLIGLVCLRMHEQRKIASLELLRAETLAAAMQRRARMFLALRDRLNTPLQSLVFAGTNLDLPVHENETMNRAVDRLVGLSNELAELDALVPSPPATLDADRELRRLG